MSKSSPGTSEKFGGEQTLTATMFTEREADGFRFFSDGKVTMDVEKYDPVG